MKNLILYIKFFINKLKSSKYQIKGKCKQCGACCKNIIFMIGDDYVKKTEQFENLKKLDKKYYNFEPNGYNEKGIMLFRCKALSDENKCKVYHFRSLYCRAYPFVNKKIASGLCEPFESCGYYFEKTKKFKEFL